MPSGPQVTVTPTVGSLPLTFRVIGRGFTPGGTAVCRVLTAAGQLVFTADVTVNQNGTFDFPFTISVAGLSGTLDLYALDNRTGRSSNHVTITIVPPSVAGPSSATAK